LKPRMFITTIIGAAPVVKANTFNFVFIYEWSKAVRISFRATRALSQLWRWFCNLLQTNVEMALWSRLWQFCDKSLPFSIPPYLRLHRVISQFSSILCDFSNILERCWLLKLNVECQCHKIHCYIIYSLPSLLLWLVM
jgi:hypothetical protein